MTLFLAWAGKDEPFSATTHALENTHIFDLDIQEKENAFPKALITLQLFDLPVDKHPTKAFISWQKPDGTQALLFQGFLVGIPQVVQEGVAQVELLGKPLDFEKQLEKFPFHHHPLFKNDYTPSSLEDIQMSSLYCDRHTLNISRSDWFGENQALPLEGVHFQDSLKMIRVKSPLSAVRINLSIEWTQTTRGLANVGREIARQFPGEEITSYSSLQLKNGTQRPGQRLGRSGYWIVRSDLQRSRTQPKEGWEGTETKPILSHYTWDFWVGWRYQQKRKEDVEIIVPHRIQSLFPQSGEEKVISLRLNNPYPSGTGHPWLPGVIYHTGSKVWDEGQLFECRTEHISQISRQNDDSSWIPAGEAALPPPPSSDRSSFFESAEGLETIHYAVQLAQWHLAKSARCVEITFQGSWENLSSLNTDQTVLLKDPQLPGGKAMGKVTHLTLRACGESGERWADVTLTCAVGDSQEAEPGAFKLSEALLPAEGLHEPPQRILRKLQILNGPQKQEEVLNALPIAARDNWQDALNRHPTRLHMQFSDMRSQNEVRQAFHVHLPEGWSAPRGVEWG